MPVDHVAHGWTSPVLSFVFSFLGSLLALMLAIRARGCVGRERVRLLLLSALVLGSTGIWLMHFVAMIGFDVPSQVLRYDLGRTAFSLGIAVVMVGFGLLLAGLGHPHPLRILIGGPVTGLGVAAMHFSGMRAISLGGRIHFDSTLVIAAVVIAVVAATTALYLATAVRSGGSTVTAAFAMAIAVSSMHYTGMAAVRVAPPEVPHTISGVSPITLLVPISALACLLLVGLFYSMAGMSVNDEADFFRSVAAVSPPAFGSPGAARSVAESHGPPPSPPLPPPPRHHHRPR